ncbi:Uncharacterised protein [Mycobacteroides abscessus subsp. massiliense]|nr:Uncharacterised protein [Mycobacteroides abscessus subsp. massiliense]
MLRPGCAVVVGSLREQRGGVGSDFVWFGNHVCERWFGALSLCGAIDGRCGECLLELFCTLPTAEPVAVQRSNVGCADSSDSLYPLIGGGGIGDIAAGCANTQSANPIRVDSRHGGQERDRRTNILDPRGRIFQETWLALALTLIARIECQGHETLCGQFLCVQAGCLFLHSAERVADHDRRQAVFRGFGIVQIPCQL